MTEGLYNIMISIKMYSCMISIEEDSRGYGFWDKRSNPEYVVLPVTHHLNNDSTWTLVLSSGVLEAESLFTTTGM